eukprot:COSAG01_NODE_1334_length_10681_cov_10.259025_8_plen_166_part_00
MHFFLNRVPPLPHAAGIISWIASCLHGGVRELAAHGCAVAERALTDTRVIATVQVCVAVYVLGIGGLHHDNVMLSASGGLFCSNCTQAFGNFRSKFGIQRERGFAGLFDRRDSPLLLALGGTPASAPFTRMADRAVGAFVACRRHARLLLASLAVRDITAFLIQK